MEQQVKILGILHVILGGMGIFGAIAILVLAGGIAGIASQSDNSGIALPLIGGIGGLIAVILLVFSLPGFIGGFGLLNMAHWSRMFMIVISALHLLHIPVGTVLGVYGLWVLTKPETELLFSRR